MMIPRFSHQSLHRRRPQIPELHPASQHSRPKQTVPFNDVIKQRLLDQKGRIKPRAVPIERFTCRKHGRAQAMVAPNACLGVKIPIGSTSNTEIEPSDHGSQHGNGPCASIAHADPVTNRLARKTATRLRNARFTTTIAERGAAASIPHAKAQPWKPNQPPCQHARKQPQLRQSRYQVPGRSVRN